MSRLPVWVLWALLVVVPLAGCISPADDGTAPPVDGGSAGANATVDAERFFGRLVCGTGVQQTVLNPCFAAAIAEGDTNVHRFKTGDGLSTLVVGMRWNATTDLGRELHLLVETAGHGAWGEDGGHRYASVSGPSSIIVRLDNGSVDRDWDWARTGPMKMQTRTFAAATMPPQIVLDQAFEIVVVRFHGDAAPADVDPFTLADEAGAEKHVH